MKGDDMKITHALLALSLVVPAIALHAAPPDHGNADGNDAGNRVLLMAQATTTTEGQVRKVDKENGKITIRHGEIRNLDMPPMTMVFQVSNPALLDNVKAGDNVRFVVDKVDGGFSVTSLDVVR